MNSYIFFFNRCFDKNRLKGFILWSLMHFGENKTIEIIEKLKDLGFQFATQAGTSLSLDDLKIPPSKAFLVSEAEAQVQSNQQEYLRGNLTSIEGFQQLVDTWHRTSEILKQEVIHYFQSTDLLNPVYMMAFSGARGNVSQVRQLVGMRGLMADPQGQIIGFPIRSNFREGLTVTEYMISCYGARKGLVDTALRTADAGYLTRRLVDVSQHIVVRTATCGTKRGIFLKDITESGQIILSLKDRLVGRVLGRDILEKQTNSILAKRNQEISANLAIKIAKLKKKILVRSPLTCSSKHGVCQLCYGWSLSHGHLVTLGEAVGIIAAQSIGEPGTQLTMRTFHTGGVFSGDVLDEIRSPHSGIISFTQPIQGVLIRTSHGRIAFLTKLFGEMILKTVDNKKTHFYLDKFTILFVRTGEQITTNQLLAEASSLGNQINERIEARKTVFSEITGQAYFGNMILGKKVGKYGDTTQISRNLGSIWILSAKKSKVSNFLKILKKGTHLINEKSLITRIHNRSQLLTRLNSKTIPLNPLSVFLNRRIQNKKRNIQKTLLNNFRTAKNIFPQNFEPLLLEKENKKIFSILISNVTYNSNFGYFISLKNQFFQNDRKIEKGKLFFKSDSVFKKLHIKPSHLSKDFSGKKSQYEKIEIEKKENGFFQCIKKLTQPELSDSLTRKQNLNIQKKLLNQNFSVLWFQDFYKLKIGGFTYINPYFLNMVLNTGTFYFVNQEILSLKFQLLPTIFFQKNTEKYFSSRFFEKIQNKKRRKINLITDFNDLDSEKKSFFWHSKKIPLFYQFNFQGKKKPIFSEISGATNLYFSNLKNLKSTMNIHEIEIQRFPTTKKLIPKNPYLLRVKRSKYLKASKLQNFIQFFKMTPKLPFEKRKIPNLQKLTTVDIQLKTGWVYFPETHSKNLKISFALNKIKKQILLDDLFFGYSLVEMDPIHVQNFNYLLNKTELTNWHNFISNKFEISTKNDVFSLNLKEKIKVKTNLQSTMNGSLEHSIKEGNTNNFLLYLRELLSYQLDLAKEENLLNKKNESKGTTNKKISLLKYYKINSQILSNSKSRFWSFKKEGNNENNLSLEFVQVHNMQKLNIKPKNHKKPNLDRTDKFIFLIRKMNSMTFIGKNHQKKKFYSLNQTQNHSFFKVTDKKTLLPLKNFFYNNFRRVKEKKISYFHTLLKARTHNKQIISSLILKKQENIYDFKSFIVGQRYNRNFVYTHSYLLKILLLQQNSEKKVISHYNFSYKNFKSFLNFEHLETKTNKEQFEDQANLPIKKPLPERIQSEIPIFHNLSGEFLYKKNKREGLILTKADQISFSTENKGLKVSIGQLINYGEEFVPQIGVTQSGQVISIEFNQITLRKAQAILFYSQGISHVEQDQWVQKNAPLLTLSYQKLVTGDIVQGIPKIEQFFEAPSTKEGEPLPDSLQVKLKKSFYFYKKQYSLPKAVRKSLQEIQEILVEGIQKVYLSQGVLIADKHLEVIIRQMTSKGKILDAGDTGLLRGEFVSLDRIESVNLSTYGQKAQYEPSVLGITQASLDSESFISAASFQETTRVLSRDTIIGKTDFLRGLKERVVLGDLIQAGTGLDDNIIYGLLMSYKSIN